MAPKWGVPLVWDATYPNTYNNAFSYTSQATTEAGCVAAVAEEKNSGK